MRSRLILLFILLSGLILRLGSLFEPVTYDEAYTYVAFASRSLWAIVSDYSLPNNHILHSILVHLSTQIVGNHPWAIRIPALVAGLGIIWMVYSPWQGALQPRNGPRWQRRWRLTSRN